MPALPWTRGRYRPDDDTTLHVLASMLPLLRFGDIPRFVRWTAKIRRQLVTAEGCAGYSLDARLLRKTFYTLSAWTDAEAMNRFVRSGSHALMLADMGGRLGEATFVESSVTSSALPLEWAAAKQRLSDRRASGA
jgi:quinol monooxygenase YgiN